MTVRDLLELIKSEKKLYPEILEYQITARSTVVYTWSDTEAESIKIDHEQGIIYMPHKLPN